MCGWWIINGNREVVIGKCSVLIGNNRQRLDFSNLKRSQSIIDDRA